MNSIYNWGMICGVLSLISVLVASLVFIIIKGRVSTFFAKLSLYLVLADVPFLVTSFFGIPVTSPTSMFHCGTASVTLQFSNLSTIFWNIIIIWTVFHTVRYSLQEEDLLSYKKKFLALSYLVPIIIAVIPLFVHLGTKSSCWVELSSEMTPEYYIYNGFYLFSFIVGSLFILGYYIRLVVFLREFTIEEVSGEFYKLMVFPIILLIVNAPDATNRVLRIFFDINVAPWVVTTQILLRQSQALCNSIIFLLSPRVRSGIRRYLRSRRRKRQQLIHSQSSIRESSDNHLNTAHDDDADSVSSVDHSITPYMYVDKSVPRRFTDHPELISKIFDSKSEFNANQPSINRSETSSRVL